MLNGTFREKMSATLTVLLLTLLVTTGQSQATTNGETFTVKLTFFATGNMLQPYPSSGEVVQGIQTADYAGGLYLPAAVKLVGGTGSDLGVESSAAASLSDPGSAQLTQGETFKVKVTFLAAGNSQPFPSSAEVVQGIQTANYGGGVYFPLSVTIVHESNASAAAVPLRDPACAASQELAMTVKTAETPMTNLDEYSCTASGGRWSLGFNAAAASGRGAIEVRYLTGNLVYIWQRPLVLQDNAAFNGCDPEGTNCWQFDQTRHAAWTCQDCNPLRSYLYLMGTLGFPAKLDGAPAPDSVEPISASGTN